MAEKIHYIYFIKDNLGWIKFGMTKNAVERLHAYSCYNPTTYRDIYHVWGGSKKSVLDIEIKIHKYLKSLNLKQHLREWFYCENKKPATFIIEKLLKPNLEQMEVCLGRENTIKYLCKKIKAIKEIPRCLTLEDAKKYLKLPLVDADKYMKYAFKRIGLKIYTHKSNI